MREGVYWIGPAAIVMRQEVHPVRYVCAADPSGRLPTIEMIVPVQRVPAGSRPIRIDCVAGLEYPRQLLSVTVVLDGPCPEDEPGISRHLDEMQAEGLQARLVRHPRYRGQIAVLDEAIAESQAEVVALTELLAPLQNDLLLKLASVHLSAAKPNPSADVVEFTRRP